MGWLRIIGRVGILWLLSIVVAGICSQQMANEPDVAFAAGAFTALSDAAFDMWAGHFLPT